MAFASRDWDRHPPTGIGTGCEEPGTDRVIRPRLYRALKPSGWLFAAAFRVPDDRRMAVLNDLRTTVSGGRAWNTDELAAMTDKPGLVSVGDIAAGSPLHLWAARRP